MSLLLGYFRRNRLVVASDDGVSQIGEDGKYTLSSERYIKFRTFGPTSRPVIVGCVGRYDLSEKLFSGLDRMMADLSLPLLELGMALPNIVAHIVENRAPSNISPERDGMQVFLAGFDGQKMRVHVFMAGDDGLQTVELTSEENNCLAALGWLSDRQMIALQSFSSYLGKNGNRLGSRWVARELRAKIQELQETHPDTIGAPGAFLDVSPRGIEPLPEDLAPAPERVATPLVNSVLAMSGTNRFFVGSISTPPATGAPTLGNNDGGPGAQIGMKTLIQFNSATPQATGNGTVANAGNSIDGDSTDYATLTVFAGSPGGTAAITCAGASGIIPSNASIAVSFSFSMPTNNLVDVSTVIPLQVLVIISGVTITTFNVYLTASSSSPRGPQALQTLTLPVTIGTASPTFNLMNVSVRITSESSSVSTSGSVVTQINDVFLVATQ